MCSGILRLLVLKGHAGTSKSLKFALRVSVSLRCTYYTRLYVNLLWLATMSGAAILSQFVLTFRRFLWMLSFV
jgi:hypothetical protein